MLDVLFLKSLSDLQNKDYVLTRWRLEFFPAVIFFMERGENMIVIRIVAGLVVSFGINIFIMLLLFNKAIKREEKRHQIAMEEIKEINNEGCV